MKYKLGEIAKFTQGFQIEPKFQFAKCKPGYKRFVRIIDYTDSNEPPRYVEDPGNRYFVSQNEIAMIRYGSQTAGKIVKGIDGVIANNLFKITLNNDVLLNSYAYYYFSQQSIFKFLRSSQSSSTMPAISFNTMNNLGIEIPDLETQKKIVRILSALDSKIENNIKQNETLERIAGEWIKKYQKEEDQKIELKNIMSFDNGFAFKSKDYQEEGKYKIITIKNVQDGNVDSSGAQCMDMLPKDIKEHHELKIGDVLLSLTGNVGRVGIVSENNLLLNQRVAKINVKNPDLIPFLYFVFRQNTFKADLENLAKGTAQLNLSPVETLEKYISYDTETALALSGKLKSLFDKIVINKQQNKELSVIRDVLLPKLMNGEINLGKVLS